MTTQPIPPTERLDDLHPSRFLKVADLLERWNVKEITVTISRMTREETTPVPSDIDPETRKPRVVIQPVLYFLTRDAKEFPRGYLLSAAVDIQSLKTSTGAQTVGDVIGKKIKIIVGEHKHNAVLRIDPSQDKE